MRDNFKKSLLKLIILMQFLFFITLNVSAESIVEINPDNPKPQDTISFNATFSNIDNIEKVVIIVKECGNEPDSGYVCYTDDFNVTMDNTNNKTYTAQITLKHENATEFNYRIGYLADNKWVWEPSTGLVKVELFASSDSSGKDTNNGISGFEVIFLIISVIFISMILNTRRR